MQAITVDEFGGAEVLRFSEVALPTPGPGEILIRVLAAGVGPWDASLRAGGYSGSLPFIPGGEFSGVVVGDTGADAFLDDGAPVYGYPALTGCYAQYVTCQAEQLAPIPGGLSAADAAAVPIDALTADQGLTDVLGVGQGDWVLIVGGSGGVGHFAVQFARLAGASVVATASPQHHEFLHKLGASVVIDHTRPDWPEQAREAMGGRADKVLACADKALEGAGRAARGGGVVATPVHAEVAETDDVSWQFFDGEPRGSRLIRMAPWFDDGSLTVEIAARYAWQDVAQAHRQVEEGHTQGKIALIVDDDLSSELGV